MGCRPLCTMPTCCPPFRKPRAFSSWMALCNARKAAVSSYRLGGVHPPVLPCFVKGCTAHCSRMPEAICRSKPEVALEECHQARDDSQP